VYSTKDDSISKREGNTDRFPEGLLTAFEKMSQHLMNRDKKISEHIFKRRYST
jgi:hypothetical protein